MAFLILAPGATPFDDIQPEDLYKAADEISMLASSLQSETFMGREKTTAFNSLKGSLSSMLLFEDLGDLITNATRLDYLSDFDDFNSGPVSFSFPIAEVETFIDAFSHLTPDSGYTLGIRVHLGKDGNGDYQMVVTPMEYQDSDETHQYDQEKTFIDEDFFALSSGTLAYSVDLEACEDLLITRLDTYAIFYGFQEFGSFIDSRTDINTLVFDLAMTAPAGSGGEITTVLSALDSHDELISATMQGATITSIGFDTGDLYPPKTYADSFF